MSFDWTPPADWMRIKTIEAHTAGEPLRVILEGFPPLPKGTILEKRRYLKENLDYLRTALMWEPRGHADMYGALLTEPASAENDVGVIFMHNEGYSTMCGHGIIGLGVVLLDCGLLQKDGEPAVIKIETPAGLITAYAYRQNGRVRRVAFHNVPSFVYLADQRVPVPGVGEVRFDIAFGGAFYALVQAEEVGVGLEAEDFRTLIDLGMRIKRAVMEAVPIRHPFEEDLSFLYGTIFVGRALQEGHHSRNVCIFAEGEVDRSPTGTGVSARLALHYARKEITFGQPIIIESILGTTFTGKVVQTLQYGPYEAVIPEVSGSASIVGLGEWLIDPQDPLQHGFILR
ncbi:MAG: proline racemase family protein [Anaerolineales bacterium]|nr:proline racemase family protein [Anaerolineales bacterium]MCS7247926.1 proline racemase family protein [Anaerolineales bacterium]MDW8161736.1 proline racemase family protein [Anaerolineales bacterium]MDW8445948.1 proline racemase family protein [Anaerolineales bacterium]